jgi:hypothetical protein
VPDDPGGVHGSGRGAKEQVGPDIVGGERLQHAHLHGSEAAPSGQHERGGHYLISSVISSITRVRAARPPQGFVGLAGRGGYPLSGS